jgi:hypothetical protein
MSIRLRLSAAILTSAIAVGAAAMPAQAAESATGLQNAKDTVTAGIVGRLSTITDLQNRLASFKDVSAADKATLSGLLSTDATALTALKATVAGETTVAAVKADGKKMVDDYRVYLLVAPKVHLVNALSVEADAVARLHKVHDALADRLAKDATADTQANKDLLSDMNAQIAAADQLIDGKIATVLAIQPGPDGKSITAQVKAVSAAAHGAREDFRKAVQDAKKVRDYIKASK